MWEEVRFTRELFWFWYAFEDSIENCFYIHPGFGRHRDDILLLTSEKIDHLFTHTFDVSTREVNLVQYRDNLELVIDSEIHIGKGLCLNPLRRINDEDSSLY